MQNATDHTHLLTKSSSPSTDSVHAVAVTLTETKHAVEPAEPRRAKSAAEDERREHIAVAAYFRAEHRGFESGHEMEDWIAAEQEVAAGEGGAGEHGPQPDP
jgi:hypothetical protein